MFSHILTIARFTLLESVRNRLFILSLLVLLSGFFLVEFIGELTLTEHRETQVALLSVYLRLSGVILVSLFVVSSSVREMQDKMLEMVIALPLHRSSYYLGKLVGFSVIAVLISVLFALELMLYADMQQVLIWAISLSFELLLVVAISLLMVFSFNQVPAAIAGVLIIYSASRLMTTLLLMAQAPIITHTSPAEKFMDGFIEMLTWVLPDLDRFAQTGWLLYATAEWQMLLPLLVQTIIYLGFLSVIAMFDFYRKSF